jgi:hypothetical protein
MEIGVPLMRRSLILSFLAWLLAVCPGCSKPENPSPPKTQVDTSPSPPAPAKPLDACSLLTSDEIKAIQGEAVENAKSTASPEGHISTSQCFFSLPTFINSISLQIVRQGTAPGAPDVKEAWKKLFPPEKLVERETESGRKKMPPRRIPDLGEEALWTGGPSGGLYVLQGNYYLRISVGGADDEAAKIRKSTALARLVLKRL